jgi:hypothetical protein
MWATYGDGGTLGVAQSLEGEECCTVSIYCYNPVVYNHLYANTSFLEPLGGSKLKVDAVYNLPPLRF